MKHDMKYTLQIEDERLSMSYKMGDKPEEFITLLEDSLTDYDVSKQLQIAMSALYDTTYLIDQTIEKEDEDLPLIM